MRLRYRLLASLSTLVLLACATNVPPPHAARASASPPASKPQLRAADWQKWTQEERQRAFGEWDTFHKDHQRSQGVAAAAKEVHRWRVSPKPI